MARLAARSRGKSASTIRLGTIPIVSAPANQTVQAGQSGTFTITASGSAPFAYQWFKNGAAIARATASSVSVLADPANVGGTYQLTVEVSNAQGKVTSAPAVMSIVAAGTGLGGTVVSAADGGSVEGSGGEGLAVEPGALSADTVITLVSQPVAAGSLPAGITALSDIVGITPANLGFQKPVALTLAVYKVVPEGTALAVLYLDASSNVVAQGRSKALADPH